MTHDLELKTGSREEIESQLKNLSTANHCGAGMLLIQIAKRELRCRIHSTDRLACEVDSIHVATSEFEHWDHDAMDALAGELVSRLSYLEERLTVIEKDRVAKETQLRSNEPLIADHSKSYFELTVGKRGLLLHRYIKKQGCVRQAVPFVLTRATLVRLSQDLLKVGY